MKSEKTMNIEKVRKLISWKLTVGSSYHDIYEDYVTPLMEALGDDVNEILSFLNTLRNDELMAVSGIFEDIYKKFMTEETWNALNLLEQKFRIM